MVISTEGTMEVVLSLVCGGGEIKTKGDLLQIYLFFLLFIRIWITASVKNSFGKNFGGIDIVKVTFHSQARGLQQVGVCSAAGTVKPNISQSYKKRPFDMPEIYQKIALK